MFFTKVLLIVSLALWSPVASGWINKQLAKQLRQLSRDEQQPQSITKCLAGFYPVIRKPGCFPKIGVVCLENDQCSTLTANSYCGWKDIDNEDLQVCQCKSGYSETSGKNEGDDDYDGYGVNEQPPKCLVNEVCSLDQFNSAMLQSNCSSPNAFCRNRVCRCKPNFVLDNHGNCQGSPFMEQLLENKISKKNFNTNTFQELVNEVHLLQDKIKQMEAEKIWSYLLTAISTFFIAAVVTYNFLKIRQVFQVENQPCPQPPQFHQQPEPHLQPLLENQTPVTEQNEI